ncbi:hypothetical protein GE061_017162 [Apolygus lucorum]|uniref:Uncharacterized protein n=1 Tax=Apolygus lucorum TaxID=248454 RepID=A0A8S9XJH0_APOLU|nr:hypothetical protein GE061_017162 [Apolygus lucorum]
MSYVQKRCCRAPDCNDSNVCEKLFRSPSDPSSETACVREFVSHLDERCRSRKWREETRRAKGGPRTPTSTNTLNCSSLVKTSRL